MAATRASLELFLAQRVFAPTHVRLLGVDPSVAWTLGNFANANAIPSDWRARGLDLVADHGNGVVLFKPRKRCLTLWRWLPRSLWRSCWGTSRCACLRAFINREAAVVDVVVLLYFAIFMVSPSTSAGIWRRLSIACSCRCGPRCCSR